MGLKARPNQGDRKRSYDFEAMSVTETVSLIRHGVISPIEVMESYIRAYESRNEGLNAIVAHRFELALDEATRLETRIQRGWDTGLLAGMPYTTKEMMSVDGMPITAGSLHRTGAVAHRDADAIAHLRKADAIPIGVTNLSELGLWYESDNPVYGRTNNPHDRNRTAGGSSGGEGAAVASGMTGFGVGSDMGGSIRIPSFYCGTFGHKPTGGHVPTAGHFPHEYSKSRMEKPPSARYISIGPITRHAEDLRPLTDVMSGRAPRFNEPPPGLEDVMVYVMDEPDMQRTSKVDATVKAAVHEAAKDLADAGATITPYAGPSLNRAIDIYTHALAEESDGMDLRTMLGGGKRPSLLRELPAMMVGRSKHSKAALMLVAGELFLSPKDARIEALSGARLRLQAEMDAYLGRNGIIVMPTLPNPAPLHGGTLKTPFDIAYTGIWNVLEVPVTSVPMGFNAAGVPVGVQIIGARGNDDLTIGIAEILQSASAGWTSPMG